jgi:LPS export ABC transporter protein LptC
MLGGVGTANESTVWDDESEIIDAFVMRDGVVLSEIESSGRKRWEVRGTRAETKDAEIIRIHNVTATILTDNGEEILVLTDAADVNKRTREIVTDLYVEIMSGDRVITGTGMHIDTERKYFKLLEDVQIVFLRQGELDIDSFDTFQ